MTARSGRGISARLHFASDAHVALITFTGALMSLPPSTVAGIRIVRKTCMCPQTITTFLSRVFSTTSGCDGQAFLPLPSLHIHP